MLTCSTTIVGSLRIFIWKMLINREVVYFHNDTFCALNFLYSLTVNCVTKVSRVKMILKYSVCIYMNMCINKV